jgi:subtilase-type serine protease
LEVSRNLAHPVSAGEIPVADGDRFWLRLGGQYGRPDSTNEAAKTVVRGAEIYGGYDFDFAAGWLGGLAIRFADKKLEVADRSSEVRANSFVGAVFYGGRNLELGSGSLRFLLSAGFSRHSLKSARRVALGSLKQTLEADYWARSYEAFLETSYAYPLFLSRGLVLEPYLSLGWVGIKLGAFSERGGSAALASDADKQDNTVSQAGMRFSAPLGQRLTLEADFGWQRTYGELAAEKMMTFAEGSLPFPVKGTALSRNEALLGVSGSLSLSDKASLKFGYDAALGKRSQNHSASLTVSLWW